MFCACEADRNDMKVSWNVSYDSSIYGVDGAVTRVTLMWSGLFLGDITAFEC